jgi:hypothetical protein
MYTVNRDKKWSFWAQNHRSCFLILPLTIVLAFVFAACGTNPGATTTASGAGNAGKTPTTEATVGNTASEYGCPAGVVANPPQGTANIIVQLKGSNATIVAQQGDVIEIRMPFGQQWSGPSTSQGVLQLQNPSGYASTTNKACVWRFIATGSGTQQLNFFAKAICKKGGMCPMYILRVPITIEVK